VFKIAANQKPNLMVLLDTCSFSCQGTSNGDSEVTISVFRVMLSPVTTSLNFTQR